MKLNGTMIPALVACLSLAAGADWADCNNIKLLYDTINTMGGIKTP